MKSIKKKVAFHTLGCKLNFAETSTIAREFPEDAFETVATGAGADIYVINTCSVTDAADKKCRQAIRRFINMSPGAFIVVTGCYAQLNPQEISAIPGVDLVLGTNEKFNIASYISDAVKNRQTAVHSCALTGSDAFNPSFSIGGRTRSFLKVQDGCDYRCSYCTIPFARGASRNPPVADLLAQATAIAQNGVKEIVITGVNTGDFGKSTDESFEKLLTELVSVEGIERFRISSIEPNLLTDEIIDLIAVNKKLLPHFHIPMQSGSDRILELMKRRYHRSRFEMLVYRICEKIPLAGIGADIITGFPGETDGDFADSLSFLETLPISYLHVFPFSERPGTAAGSFPGKIPFTEKERRSKALHELSLRKHNRFMELNTGESTEVLFEKTRKDGYLFGFSSNYIKTKHPWQPKLAGMVRKARMTEVSGADTMLIELID
ncbi:MAG: tRNA (N(6)-L-threonylcarbamoyladenosine(37)-C(2))-methylthiotransferase MtaB [Bacteroidales bacterium]|jgi:threonylcarbamoyladenosine tRNA methylthiotransferase MtaB|nr:tRNA (N(6)-L-threonylcarbamoyladenosine(37)-C(2))-methylthiotransferase MtaB [Bacteroidales bacterium]